MTFSLFSFAAVFLSSAVAAMGLGGGTILLLYLSFFSPLSQPQMQSLNLLLFLPVAGLSLYFHRKNIDMSNKKRYKKRENFAKRRKA